MSNFDIILDNSQQNLREVPVRILDMYNLKMLYLQGNLLEYLPEDFFLKLHQLNWLDLRNNKLVAIPQTVAYHQHLENLLLSNNKIESLPNELGTIATLRVIQVGDNPILYPSRKILTQGTKAIVNYLKEEYDKENIELPPEPELEESKAEPVPIKPKKAPSKETVRLKESASLIITGLSPSSSREIKTRNIIHNVSKSASKICIKSVYRTDKVLTNSETDHASISKENSKQNWLENLAALLSEQEKILQQEKNLQVLGDWRYKMKIEPTRALSATQISPPYGTYTEYNTILSRDDVDKQIEKMVNRETKPLPKEDLEKVMSDLMSQLKGINSSATTDQSPRTEMEETGKEMAMIMTIHKKLMQLQQTNKSHLK